jgi:folylpolyglutamate synthase/dihydropteroate synthase
MYGGYAAANAGAGVVAFEALTGHALDDAALREGLSSARTPGRLEVIAHAPTVVLDGAHNPAGAEALAEALARSFIWDRLHVVLAVSANKDVPGVIAPIAALADAVYATENDSVRSAGRDVVAAAARDAGAGSVSVEPSVASAIDAARSAAARGDLVLVTGSLFTVADAKRALQPAA